MSPNPARVAGARPDKRLLLSIHDVGPRFSDEIEQLADKLSALAGEARFAMLVVPEHWGGTRLADDSAFQARLRRWAEQGVEMFVHGWFHKDAAQHSGTDAFKAQFMTAGEGEFLNLSREEAVRRMAEGRALIEDVIGMPCAGFIAPAWLYGDGAREALRDCDFALAEDHFRVWRPQDDVVLARGPVITWASRSGPRTASSLFFAGLARNTLKLMPNVRIAVHPGDVTKQSILTSIDRTVRAFLPSHVPSRYASLLASA